MKVTITTEDFATSSYHDQHNCALAKALKRELNLDNIIVGGFRVAIDGEDKYKYEYEYATELIIRCGKPDQEPLTVTLTKI